MFPYPVSMLIAVVLVQDIQAVMLTRLRDVASDIPRGHSLTANSLVLRLFQCFCGLSC